MAVFVGCWVGAILAAFRGGRLLPLVGLALLILLRDVAPSVRLLAASYLWLLLFKGACLSASGVSLGLGRRFLYFLWPGMDAESFTRSGGAPVDTGPRFVRGLLSLYAGVAMLLVSALLPPSSGRAWFGVGALLTLVHFGFANLLTSAYQLLGYSVKPLFERPLASTSLNEFWTRRWNLAFVEMNRRLFMPALVRRVGIRRAVTLSFLISGALHEMAISYPAGSGWGGPMAYFALQAALVAVERKLPGQSLGRLGTWVAVLLPLPILFHGPFMRAFIHPLLDLVRDFIASHSATDLVSRGLWVAGALQFLVLAASFQVPARLKWKEELPRLSRFNQKLMWTYGLFIVLCIVSFGALTLIFHDQFMAREPLALGMACFIAVFWLLRVIVDGFYFNHRDWPEGPQFVAGHALLTSLFVVLVLIYGSLLWPVRGLG